MYLHELGEEAASFTKEEMQQGWVLWQIIDVKSVMVCTYVRLFKCAIMLSTIKFLRNSSTGCMGKVIGEVTEIHLRLMHEIKEKLLCGC